MNTSNIFETLFTPTSEASLSLLLAKYAAVLITIILTASITFWFIRKIADLIIFVSLLGAAWVVCQSIHDGNISSWAEAIGAAIGTGIIASLLCIPLLPLSSGNNEAKKSENYPPQPYKIVESMREAKN